MKLIFLRGGENFKEENWEFGEWRIFCGEEKLSVVYDSIKLS